MRRSNGLPPPRGSFATRTWLDSYPVRKPFTEGSEGKTLGPRRQGTEAGGILATSNGAPTEWSDLCGNPLLASAGLDRLARHAATRVITGCSFRAQGRQPSENPLGADVRDRR